MDLENNNEVDYIKSEIFLYWICIFFSLFQAYSLFAVSFFSIKDIDPAQTSCYIYVLLIYVGIKRYRRLGKINNNRKWGEKYAGVICFVGLFIFIYDRAFPYKDIIISGELVKTIGWVLTILFGSQIVRDFGPLHKLKL